MFKVKPLCNVLLTPKFCQVKCIFVPRGKRFRIGNIVDHLGGAQKRIQKRQSALFYKADPDYGRRRVAEGLKLDVNEVERLAKMSQEERAKATAH